MPDRFSKETRSRIMSKIRGRDTKPEILLRKALWRDGYRYSLRYRFKEINCRPDIVMVSRKICIFVDGCFWHGCPKCFRKPKSNLKYWNKKISGNLRRDKAQNVYLKRHGWKVIRVWEHTILDNRGLKCSFRLRRNIQLHFASRSHNSLLAIAIPAILNLLVLPIVP